MLKLATAASAVAILAFAPAAYAGYGYTHTETTAQQKQEMTNRNVTHYRTQHQKVNVPDITHLKEITRVHPRVHEEILDLYLHHVVPKEENTYSTRTHIAPEQVEKNYQEEHVGSPGAARSHEEIRYRDVYRDENRQVVHEHHINEVGLTVHHHITDVTVTPIVHETIVTRVVPETVYQPQTVVEKSEVQAAPQVIVSHRREDRDP